MRLSSRNTVVYSTASSGYALKAATSLMSVRKVTPDIDLYILSSSLSAEERRVLDNLDIKYHEFDLSNEFTKTWEYPIECYYIFAGPRFFDNLGYRFSLYIDGDILCLKNPLEGVGKFELVASAGHSESYWNIFGEDRDVIQKSWPNIANKLDSRFNTGVVYFNNVNLCKMDFYGKIVELYNKCIDLEIPRKGDDSLFALFYFIYLYDNKKAKFLDKKYNYMTHKYNLDSAQEPVFIHFTESKPWHSTGDSSDISDKYKILWMSIYDEIIQQSKVHDIRKVKEVVSSNKKIYDLYLYLLGIKRSIISRKLATRKPAIKLYWWSDPSNNICNFGDEVTRDIIHTLFGRHVQYARIDECEMIGVGSIIEVASGRTADNHIDVWGSGFIEKSVEGYNPGFRNMSFFAVRGEVSVSRIPTKFRSGVVTGDPGLLASLVYEKSEHTHSKIGVVVHYADKDLPVVEKIKWDNRFVIINPLDSPSKVAEEITSCSLILSSSLHGLIFADSYHIPNFHIKLSGRLVGGVYKFNDYYTGTHRGYRSADIDKIFDSEYIQSLMHSYVGINDLTKIQRDLVRSFPR